MERGGRGRGGKEGGRRVIEGRGIGGGWWVEGARVIGRGKTRCEGGEQGQEGEWGRVRGGGRVCRRMIVGGGWKGGNGMGEDGEETRRKEGGPGKERGKGASGGEGDGMISWRRAVWGGGGW